MPEAALHRSFLYGPGSNERILAKVLDVGADAVVLDLEDAVSAEDKDGARERVAAFVADRAPSAASAVHVRVNRDGDEFSAADIRAVVRPGLAALRLPKCEAADAVAALDPLLDELEAARGLEADSVGLYPTVESAAGVLAAGALARASRRVVALAFGSSDFLGDLGILGEGEAALLIARSTLALESRAAGIGRPVDGAFTDLGDLDGLRRVCEQARALGFAGKSAIHPRQVPVIHEVFTPGRDEIAWAERIVASLDPGGGTAVVDGEFVDPAVITRARAILQLSDAREREDRGSE